MFSDDRLLNPWNPRSDSTPEEAIANSELGYEASIIESPAELGRDSYSMMFAIPDNSDSFLAAVTNSMERRDSPSTVATANWIHQQSDLVPEAPDPEIPEEKAIEPSPPPISLFQGFRAATPRSSIGYKERMTSIVKNNLIVPEVCRKSISNANSSLFAKVPKGAHHQEIALNNIAKIFNELISRREQLLGEGDNLENERLAAEDELRQVEDIITKFTKKKKDIIYEINQIIQKEDTITESLDVLDSRIASISEETVHVEKTVRRIRGTVKFFTASDDEPEEPNSCIKKTLFGHTDSVECLDFETPYGHLVTGSADKTLRVWDLSSNECIGVLQGHNGWIRAVQSDGYTLVSGSGDCTAKIWDISRLTQIGGYDESDCGQELLKTFEGHTGGVTCLQFSDSKLVTGSVDKTIRQWDMETGLTLNILRSELPLEGFDSIIDKVIYGDKDSVSDEVLDLNEGISVWDDTTEISHNESKTRTSRIYDTSGHVGGLHYWQHALAAGYGDGAIRLFDLRNGCCQRVLMGHRSTVSSVTFDNNLIISGSIDRTVKIWDLRMGSIVDNINCPGNVTHLSVDFSRISISCSRKALLLYQRSNGTVTEIVGHSKSTRSSKMSGKRLITTSMDKTIKLWHCEPLA